MCGKFTQIAGWAALVERAAMSAATRDGPSETVTPMRFATAIRLDAQGARETARMRWGFIPAGTGDPAGAKPFIHARAETADMRPTFRSAFAARRALVVVTSFNEGREITPTKTEQHTITARDGQPLAIAAIWERTAVMQNVPLDTFAMVTVVANTLIGTITDRMPAIVRPEDWARWLGEGPACAAALKAMLVPFEGDWQMARQAPARRGTSPAQPELF